MRMTLGLTSKLSLSTLVLLVCCSWSGAQAAALTCPSDRNTICFGDYDIGTPAKQTLIVVNNTDAIVNLSASISGPNPGDVPGDFALASVCRGEVSPKASCQIEVAFNPAVIGKDKGEGEDRKATLTVLTEKGDLLEKASLWGKAFQNLGVTPTTLDFESQLGSVSGVSREVRITNYTNAAVSGVVVTLTGDFTENHTSCSTPLSPGGSCALSVGFAPKQARRFKWGTHNCCKRTQSWPAPKDSLLARNWPRSMYPSKVFLPKLEFMVRSDRQWPLFPRFGTRALAHDRETRSGPACSGNRSRTVPCGRRNCQPARLSRCKRALGSDSLLA